MLCRLACSLAMLSLARADLPHFSNSSEYSIGYYGHYPSQSFVSSDLIAPRLNILTCDVEVIDTSFTFLSVWGRGVAPNGQGALILDSVGSLVWSETRHQDVFNVRPHVLNGQNYLSFWVGNTTSKGHGAGHFCILDDAYVEIAQIRPIGAGLALDWHAFELTDEHTAIVVIFETIPADLSSIGGPSVGSIRNSIFQEINLKDNTLVFQWNASEHVALAMTALEPSSNRSNQSAFDYVHLNSVTKDSSGNYLVSCRSLNSILYIDGTTGHVIWALGGKLNSFSDAGGATSFLGQHDARWVREGTSLTFFDNGAQSQGSHDHPSRGMRIDLDLRARPRTARLVQQYTNKQTDMYSRSQGSVQVLPNGNVLVGYGENAAWAEYSTDGRVICDVHWQPAKFFGTGQVQSYRTVRYPWVGRPTTRPKLWLDPSQRAIYVSWNGATEIWSWLLQDVENGVATDLQRTIKDGFETRIDTQQFRTARCPSTFRVVALDKDGTSLGHSEEVAFECDRLMVDALALLVETTSSDPLRLNLMAVVIFGACITCAWMSRARKRIL